MPIKRSLAKRSKRLCDYKRQQLLSGPDSSILAGVGYLTAASLAEMSADDQATALAHMERDWLIHRDELLAWWNAGPDADHSGFKPWTFVRPQGPDCLPWASEQFDG